MIRWGSAIEHEAQTLLNQRQAIIWASNKLVALRKMQEAGVNVPSFWTLPRDRPEGVVVLGRSHHGSQGRDIRVYQPDEPLALHELYTAYIPNRREYRVHVFRDEVIRVQGKWQDYPEMQTNPYIKNHAQGYRFRQPRWRLNNDRLEMAKLAVSSLGLDFGAVDMLIGEDRQTYVLEVNTAPSCSPLTAARYVEKMAELLEIEPNLTALEVLAVDPEE